MIPAFLLTIGPSTVRLPRWFSDGMVLQTSSNEGPPAFLAGNTVPPGESVHISGDAGTYTVTSESSTGRWKIALRNSSGWTRAKTGMTIVVQGATGPAAVATGVLAGDVFFCAGQSNMLFSLHQAINYTAEAATLSSYPNFRFFMANRALNATPQFDLTTDDKNCDAAVPPPPPPPPPPTAAPLCAAAGFLVNTAFGRGDGPSVGHAPAKDAADCCAQCSSATWAAKGCLYFTWHPPVTPAVGGTCFFKTSSRGPTLNRTGYISGGTGAPPPPPPPPKPCNRWLTAANASADDFNYLLSFSAVCFLTIRDLAMMHTHDRPMGLVQAAWGGSRVEAWMSKEALQNAGAPVMGNVPPVVNPVKSAANVQSALFNGMVSPFTNMSIRAALWYQGEQNADQSCQANSSMMPGAPASHVEPVLYYSVAYAAMLRDWRDSKGINFSVVTMQLPPSVKSGVDPAITNPLWAGRPDIREAEAISAAHPGGNTTLNSGVAVTIDCGGSSNWGNDHPPNKPEMSRRLALQLLHISYALGQDAIPLWTGPVLSHVAYSPTTQPLLISLEFTRMSSQGGLSLRDVRSPTSVDDGRDGVPSSTNNCIKCCSGGGAPFEVTFDKDPAGARRAGRNVTWTRLARNQIVIGEKSNAITLKLSGEQLSAGNVATGVRYAWTDFVDCVLDNGNSSGIPAGPFRRYL